MTGKGKLYQAKRRKIDQDVYVTEYAGKKPTAWNETVIKEGDQKRKSAKTPRSKKWPFSNKRKHSGLKVRSRPKTKTRRHQESENQQIAGRESGANGQSYKKMRGKRNQVWCWGEGEMGCRKQAEVKSFWTEQELEKDRCSPTSACSTNLSLCRRNISLFQKREFLLVPDIISFPSEYRIEALLNRI